MVIEVIVAAFLIMLVSLIGVIFVGSVAKKFVEERLSYLISFSAGVFLVTAGALILEVFEIYESSLLKGVGFITCGYFLAFVLEWCIPESHHHHTLECEHGHGKGARKILIGDAIHNVTDGIILVPAFMVSPALGIAVTISILIHESLQEVSEFFVLKQAGFTTKRALITNFIVSGTIFIGVALSYGALATHELEGVLLSLSAGFFLHVVLHDLLPKHGQHESMGTFIRHIFVLVVGLGVMASINFMLKESHAHGDTQEASPQQVDDHTKPHSISD